MPENAESFLVKGHFFTYPPKKDLIHQENQVFSPHFQLLRISQEKWKDLLYLTYSKQMGR